MTAGPEKPGRNSKGREPAQRPGSFNTAGPFVLAGPQPLSLLTSQAPRRGAESGFPYT
jgi:hypothetical protein